MNILIGCESSGETRDAFIARGHDAVSCDLLPTQRPGPHYRGDIRDILCLPWDMLIVHPTCTFLCSSGLHWNKRREDRAQLTEDAVAFARMFMDGPESSHIPKRVVENPIGCLSSRVRKPDQIIQPYQFGDDASKATCLWLYGLPILTPTQYVEPRVVMHNGKLQKRWANQTDSGQNNLPPSADRWRIRSKTYPGIAQAFALQWG